MPPYPQIHKCPNDKFRIGNGGCKFSTKQAAINAFEKWIKTKKDYEELGQEISMIDFVEEIGKNIDQWLEEPDLGDLIKEHKGEFTIHDLADYLDVKPFDPNEKPNEE